MYKLIFFHFNIYVRVASSVISMLETLENMKLPFIKVTVGCDMESFKILQYQKHSRLLLQPQTQSFSS
jgi:hypothetical protein